MYDSRFVFCCRASVLVQFHCFGLHILIHFSSNLSVHIHIYVYMYIYIIWKYETCAWDIAGSSESKCVPCQIRSNIAQTRRVPVPDPGLDWVPAEVGMLKKIIC